jgi:hypothetical protein
MISPCLKSTTGEIRKPSRLLDSSSSNVVFTP